MTDTIKISTPPEWDSRVNCVLVAYPAAHTDWTYILNEAQHCFNNIIKEISDVGLKVLIIGNEPEVRLKLKDAGIISEHICVVDIPYDDTWARDFGMISIEKNNKIAYLDFKFNGWGLKFRAANDNRICRALTKFSHLNFKNRLINRQNFVLEGGSIETDGNGTILTTSKCLLSPNRNAEFTKQDIEKKLCKELGASRILWLNHGELEGDDTDSHIDTIARFVNIDTIAYVKCYRKEDSHYKELQLMEEELRTFLTKDGHYYNLIPLPLPEPIFDDNGNRLPATYANFLITPTTLFVPTYKQEENDNKAIQILKKAFNNLTVKGIDCTPLIKQHGSLHCVTMQLIC